MKIKVILVISIIINSKLIVAQSFEEGQSMFTIGYGLVGYRAAFFDALISPVNNNSNEPKIKKSQLGPVYLKYEYMSNENVSIGINFAAVNLKYSRDYTTSINGRDSFMSESWDFMSYSILGRINYHYSPDEKVDFYSGIGFGYRFARNAYIENGVKDPSASASDNMFPVGFDLTQGVRIMLTNELAIYGEIGLAKSMFQLGASYKF